MLELRVMELKYAGGKGICDDMTRWQASRLIHWSGGADENKDVEKQGSEARKVFFTWPGMAENPYFFKRSSMTLPGWSAA